MGLSTKKHAVYKLTLTDGRVYIGMTQQKLYQRCRKGAYNHCPAMSQAIRDYGWDAFSVNIIADGLSQKEAEQVERDNIALYDSTNPNKGFNVALGGNIEGRHSIATRQKMSMCQKGRHFSQEHLSKMRKPKLNGSLRRSVIQYDKEGCFLCEFPSIKEAVESIGGRKECIIRCCNNVQQTHKGFRWAYGKRGVKG